ncbi:MAG: MoxR family ATPase [Elusimicrobia bacterium]|nr:MoxR family ATPase [Candidatus Obscuribacterium magneticum]
MEADIKQIHERIQKESVFVQSLKKEISQVIVGQNDLIEKILVGLLSDGHILLEGVPGLAKTLIIKTLAQAIQTEFKRIQFTPDLLPADLIGTTVYNPKTQEFAIRKGPIFTHLLLADEINRAPAKVQSALLEAMQEKQVTIGESSHSLSNLFLVLATQNPIEQEGTYPLPEAQIDRFMMKLKVDYPSRGEEMDILNRMTATQLPKVRAVVQPEEILKSRSSIKEIYIDMKIKNYILDLVFATRKPEDYKLSELKKLIAYGASPRATIFLTEAAKAYAFLQGRGYVTPEDIKAIGADILRHRIILTYEAEAEETTSDEIITTLFNAIEVP